MKVVYGFMLCCTLLLACSSRCYKGNIRQLYNRGMLSADLAPIALNESLLACPIEADETANPQQHEGWSAPLPDQALFGLFSIDQQYALCRDIFQDTFFQQALQAVPLPDSAAIDWYNYRKDFQLKLLPLETAHVLPFDSLDVLQRKMIHVLYHVKNWKFLPQTRTEGNYILHGQYLEKDQTILLYKTACKAANIYDISIKKAALTHRYYFIGTHELGHAMDQLRNDLDFSTTRQQARCEMQANIYGLIMTKALARLFSAMVQEYDRAFSAYVGPKKPCDSILMKRAMANFSAIEKYLDTPLEKQKALLLRDKMRLTALKKTDWGAWGCMGKR